MKKIFKLRISKWFLLLVFIFTLPILYYIVFKEKTIDMLYEFGYSSLYYGKNQEGNEIISFAIDKMDNPDAGIFRHSSVQNTKNGNYNIAISYLEKAYKLSPEGTCSYYGWVLLYYYHDYKKALEILTTCDSYTPDFSDAPMGEDIHYLKGLAFMKLDSFESAINEFDFYISSTIEANGENWVDVYAFINKGRCLAQIGQQKNAIKEYKKALKYFKNCTEAYYYMALSQIDLHQNESACQNLNTAQNLILKGYKNSNPYVELFHEIYEQQIEAKISRNCPEF